MSATRRLLLVSPAFHGYWAAIARAFTDLGYAVATHPYDAQDRWRDRARLKLVAELPSRLGWVGSDVVAREQSAAAVEAVRAYDPDVLLVVKGDTLGEDFWSLVEQRRQRRGLWLYDELRRTRHTEDSLTAAGPIATYSPLDAAALTASGRHAVHVPLAFDDSRVVRPRPIAEVSFIGARYPGREALLTRMAAAGVPVRAFGRDWSDHPVDRLRTWRLRRLGLPSGRDLARHEAYAVMAGSPATLNIHGDQDGFTMRTFEAPGSGAVHLCDRPDVSAHYEPGKEVAVFTSAEEAIELSRRAFGDPTWARRLREAGRRRTLAEHTFAHRARALQELWS